MIVYKIDRLSREEADWVYILDLFKKYRITSIAVTQPVDTKKSEGWFYFYMLRGLGQFERIMTSDRIRDKIEASKKKGMWTGGYPPLGYDVNEKQLIINMEELKRILLIYKRFLVLRSSQKVADELNSCGYKTKYHISESGKASGGKHFLKSHIRKILTYPVYKGYIPHKENIYKGQHEAIILETLWDEVQSVFKVSPHIRGAETRRMHSALLKSILRCAPCDVPMTPTYTKKKNRNYHY